MPVIWIPQEISMRGSFLGAVGRGFISDGVVSRMICDIYARSPYADNLSLWGPMEISRLVYQF
jgi:hypothetical protein